MKIEDVRGIQIFDIEVFAHDWVVVSYDVDKEKYQVFHNDNQGVRDWIEKDNPLLMGFNSANYDNYILLSIIKGNSPETVKELNDFIINKNEDGNRNLAWKHPSIAGMYANEHLGQGSGDLRWDLAQNLSLKRIEGNLGMDIRESGIDFDIEHKLSKKELAEVIEYCKADVKSTYHLFKMRKEYLDTKLAVAEYSGSMTPQDALTKKNAKLVASFLHARKLKYPWKDEFSYKIPDNVILGKYDKVVRDFFENGYETVREQNPELYGRELARTVYKTSTTFNIGDMEVKLAWGGIHGAEKNATYETNAKRSVVDIDVGSYYPSIMLKYDFMSSSLDRYNKNKFADVYQARLDEKHKGNSDRAAGLKLILNTTYGATKDQFNEMYEPRIANSICITGQVLLVDLMEKLEKVKGVHLIQANTDGIIFDYNKKDEKKIRGVVQEWEDRTGMNMEYTVIKKIVEKDVNNYAALFGETYLFKDGERVITKPDKDKGAYKGGWLKGTDLESRACQYPILATALRENLMHGTPVEETVRNCKDVFQFQYVFQPSRDDVSVQHCVDGVWQETQRTNRLYAVKDEKYGQVKIVDSRYATRLVADCPPHARIDNACKVKLKDLDIEWYVEKAKKRQMAFSSDKSAEMLDLSVEDVNRYRKKENGVKR